MGSGGSRALVRPSVIVIRPPNYTVATLWGQRDSVQTGCPPHCTVPRVQPSTCRLFLRALGPSLPYQGDHGPPRVGPRLAINHLSDNRKQFFQNRSYEGKMRIFNRHLLRCRAKASACSEQESPPRMAGLRTHTLLWKGLVLHCREWAASPASPPLPCSLTVRGGGSSAQRYRDQPQFAGCEQHPKVTET